MQMQTADMQKACDQAISKRKRAVLAAFRNVQFAAVNNLASAIVPKLNDLCVQQVIIILIPINNLYFTF